MIDVDRHGNPIGVGDYLRIDAGETADLFAIVTDVSGYPVQCLYWRKGRVQYYGSAVDTFRVRVQPNEVPPEIRLDLEREVEERKKSGWYTSIS